MHISQLKEKNKLIKLFCDLVEIPSPSLNEQKLIDWISDYLKEKNINFKLDSYCNIIINIPATDPTKEPLLLSAHLDVVGDFSPINLELADEYIKTDGKRTLGADDKAGVACALILTTEISSNEFKIQHGGLEVVLTRDEEHGMTGIKAMNFSELNSKNVLVLDSDKLGQLLVSGASYTNAKLTVETYYGGHSGLDIADEKRLNAAKLISELINNIPQGVYYSDETGTITSINLGTIIAGNIQNTASKIASESILMNNYLDFFMENSITNVINTQACATYSIRSADNKKESELKRNICNIISDFNNKYKELAKAEIKFSEHLPAFEKSNDDYIVKIHKKACDNLGITQKISSFHAGAETHIYSKNVNSKNENFIPMLFGTSDIYNMHSCDEKINYKTLLKGYELLKELFLIYNS